MNEDLLREYIDNWLVMMKQMLVIVLINSLFFFTILIYVEKKKINDKRKIGQDEKVVVQCNCKKIRQRVKNKNNKAQ